MVLNKATVLEWYEDQVVHSARWSTALPAVMMLNEYQKKKHTVRFSKSNVFLRDGYRCQYCGVDLNRRTATLDHVLPISCGGQSTFENTVTACSPCNSIKGNNRRIVPHTVPKRPNYFQLVEQRKRLGWDLSHPSWKDYIR
jgi:5-methylcytosine-specific restriction endonuclease McrA